MQSSEISQAFLEFHRDKGFSVLPGGSLLDPSIPMTFVMSTGLSQVEMALDQEEDWDGKQYVMTQKCFRHFDVRAVGDTSVHLSLFEMPAAFLFRSSQKKARVHHMWKFLTGRLGCPEDRMWATYFAGDEVSGHWFNEDTEVYQAWREIGLPAAHVVGLGADSNFWQQGDGLVGKNRYHKCASYTEAFFDRGARFSCGPDCGPGCDCGRFIEVANTLFVDKQIDEKDNELQPLATPFVEFVVGAERLAMVLQERGSIFDIDVMIPLKRVIRELGKANGVPPNTIRESEDVLADHLRALFFLVRDGAPPPGGDGRERIVKILIRRIVTRQIILGIDLDSLPVMADAVVAEHSESPRLAGARDEALCYIREESERFRKTLARGKRRFEEFLKKNDGNTLTGDQIIHLEKRKGVPSLLVEIWLLEQELSFDRVGYEDAWRRWRTALEKRLERNGQEA